MGSDVTGFSQSVESKSDKRSTELHHHSFDPEEISILLLFQRIPHLIVENSAAHAAHRYFELGIWNLLTRNAIFAWIQTPHV